MNRLKATLVAATVLFASHAWAQPAAQADQGAAPSKHNDEIVQMRMEIAAANKKYNQKVAAARKVYNHKKSEAAKERDAAVAAAHNGVSGQ
ncbi:hypothetical protein [Caballeronia sp. INML2]|jgi:hypothetical protein|uniref:hypothetical protein n=1 Tax=Caballeronia sp. INML2 TaxID=2921748 RepID=UPI00202966F0|nr:hypothetical protein [Caballeronia sp. INML2]